MRLFYCPKCHKEEIKDGYPLKNKITYKNIRDGYGRPITHYECECGNLLAGSVSITGWEDDKGAIDYIKETIKGYNKGGLYYTDGLYEAVEAVYNSKNRL